MLIFVYDILRRNDLMSCMSSHVLDQFEIAYSIVYTLTIVYTDFNSGPVNISVNLK